MLQAGRDAITEALRRGARRSPYLRKTRNIEELIPWLYLKGLFGTIPPKTEPVAGSRSWPSRLARHRRPPCGQGSSAIHSKRYQAFLQRQVADRLDQHQSFVEKCEQGSRRVDAAELFPFAKIYNKPVEYFDPGNVKEGPRPAKRR